MKIIQVKMVDGSWLNVHSILDDTFTVSSFGRVPASNVTEYKLQNMHPEMQFRTWNV